MKEYSSARKLCEVVLERNPELSDARVVLSKIAFFSGDTSKAQKLCEEIIESDPTNSEANEFFWSARYSSCKHKEKEWNYHSQMIKSYKLTNDVLSLSLDDFNKTILTEIDDSKGWIHEPVQYATFKGKQLVNLRDNLPKKSKVREDLYNFVKRSTLEYLKDMSKLDTLYFNQKRDELVINSWAVELSSGGHQSAHVHPGGWISGVYYVGVPNFKEKLSGALAFGFKNTKSEFEILKHVVPEEGCLILFPSYMTHKTIPFSTNESRVSIAFDII